MLSFERYGLKFFIQEGPRDFSPGTAPSRHACDSVSLCFCAPQAIKNWRQEWHGNEVTIIVRQLLHITWFKIVTIDLHNIFKCTLIEGRENQGVAIVYSARVH